MPARDHERARHLAVDHDEQHDEPVRAEVDRLHGPHRHVRRDHWNTTIWVRNAHHTSHMWWRRSSASRWMRSGRPQCRGHPDRGEREHGHAMSTFDVTSGRTGTATGESVGERRRCERSRRLPRGVRGQPGPQIARAASAGRWRSPGRRRSRASVSGPTPRPTRRPRRRRRGRACARSRSAWSRSASRPPNPMMCLVNCWSILSRSAWRSRSVEERRVPGAEVVDGDPDAVLAQRRQRQQRPLGARDDVALDDLDLEVVGGEPELVHDPQRRRGELPIDQALRGHVQAQPRHVGARG